VLTSYYLFSAATHHLKDSPIRDAITPYADLIGRGGVALPQDEAHPPQGEDRPPTVAKSSPPRGGGRIFVLKRGRPQRRLSRAMVNDF